MRRDDDARLKEVGGVVARLRGPAAVEDFAAEQAAALPALRAALSVAAARRPLRRRLGPRRQAGGSAGLARFVDLDGALLLARDPFTGIEVEGEVLRASEAPGLGVEPAA